MRQVVGEKLDYRAAVLDRVLYMCATRTPRLRAISQAMRASALQGLTAVVPAAIILLETLFSAQVKSYPIHIPASQDGNLSVMDMVARIEFTAI